MPGRQLYVWDDETGGLVPGGTADEPDEGDIDEEEEEAPVARQLYEWSDETGGLVPIGGEQPAETASAAPTPPTPPKPNEQPESSWMDAIVERGTAFAGGASLHWLDDAANALQWQGRQAGWARQKGEPFGDAILRAQQKHPGWSMAGEAATGIGASVGAALTSGGASLPAQGLLGAGLAGVSARGRDRDATGTTLEMMGGMATGGAGWLGGRLMGGLLGARAKPPDAPESAFVVGPESRNPAALGIDEAADAQYQREALFPRQPGRKPSVMFEHEVPVPMEDMIVRGSATDAMEAIDEHIARQQSQRALQRNEPSRTLRPTYEVQDPLETELVRGSAADMAESIPSDMALEQSLRAMQRGGAPTTLRPSYTPRDPMTGLLARPGEELGELADAPSPLLRSDPPTELRPVQEPVPFAEMLAARGEPIDAPPGAPSPLARSGPPVERRAIEEPLSFGEMLARDPGPTEGVPAPVGVPQRAKGHLPPPYDPDLDNAGFYPKQPPVRDPITGRLLPNNLRPLPHQRAPGALAEPTDLPDYEPPMGTRYERQRGAPGEIPDVSLPDMTPPMGTRYERLRAPQEAASPLELSNPDLTPAFDVDFERLRAPAGDVPPVEVPEPAFDAAQTGDYDLARTGSYRVSAPAGPVEPIPVDPPAMQYKQTRMPLDIPPAPRTPSSRGLYMADYGEDFPTPPTTMDRVRSTLSHVWNHPSPDPAAGGVGQGMPYLMQQGGRAYLENDPGTREWFTALEAEENLKRLTGGRAQAQADVAYAGAPTLSWTVQSVLTQGDTGLPDDEVQRLTEAVVRGDTGALSAADFRLKQRYPAYARRIERELRALNGED